MGISFACLLALQVYYIHEVRDLRRRHFDESVTSALSQVAHQIELDEAADFLEKGANRLSDNNEILGSDDETLSSSAVHQIDTTFNYSLKSSSRDKYFTRINRSKKGKNADNVNRILRQSYIAPGLTDQTQQMAGKTPSLQDKMKQRYEENRWLVEEVIYSMMYATSDRPLEERIDFKRLDRILKSELVIAGIDLPYHFRVTTASGALLYQCPDYETEGESTAFIQSIFSDEPPQKVALLKVHFPEVENSASRSALFIMPSLIFTLILLITFAVTMILVFRQKKLTELKNDFINNMTHEFKTPISSISLAAQMLGDDSVSKTPKMMNRLTTTIIDETKRLRFQVEKVLQLSMYENQRANLNLRNTDVNELIAGVIHTFTLKVEKNGGKIISDLKASMPTVLVDEMHLTNVIFNLMDNAVKYRREDTQLELKLSTWNENHRVCISIQDNGIGIKHDDLKKIFDKFFRVHTGNLHDVKGFGLGLAYVKKIVNDHKGTITVESELGIGTKFVIRLPESEEV